MKNEVCITFFKLHSCITEGKTKSRRFSAKCSNSTALGDFHQRTSKPGHFDGAPPPHLEIPEPANTVFFLSLQEELAGVLTFEYELGPLGTFLVFVQSS